MVVNKRKKSGRYRGRSNHGHGARKKRRGAGSRGGRGNAGTGKRAGQKKAGMPLQLGRHGFTSKSVTARIESINFDYFTPKKITQLLAEKKIAKEEDRVVIDLATLGYQKLLGSGTPGRWKISCQYCSEKAKQKLEEAGGEVVIA
ncbi:uL15 family ribosomal protein [Candidatus Woesearchaeota archaeon]|nr:uL15 family ribosomal protein [Candidatus Woesearchaeota archaeon]